LATTLSLALLVGGALAGAKYNNAVYVSQSGRYAYGAMGAARNSSDTNQLISCAIGQISSTSEVLTGWCAAQDANGTYVVCGFTNQSVAAFQKVLATQTPDSYYSFGWDANGNCTYLYVSNESNYEPKKP
jgi:hypothetical protein